MTVFKPAGAINARPGFFMFSAAGQPVLYGSPANSWFES
jgi:hypothetical protein